MKIPDAELIDDDNPAWSEETFKKAIPFSELPVALQELLQSEMQIVPEKKTTTSRKPAA
jgi:hypothetical protein